MKPQRFLVLDGMRGIAAFAVLWMHAGFGFGAAFYPRHGYLAVDFFFALSGFVLAHAYGSRIFEGLSFTAFARIRLIRLYPLIFLGAVLGALAFDPGWPGSSAELFWLNSSIFLILPFGLLFHLSAFPVNTPVWSLFFEFVANAVYFFNARRDKHKALKALVFLMASGLVLAAITHLAGSLRNVGVASFSAFLAGIPRVAFSFGLGVLMHRYALTAQLPRLPDYAVALALAALLAVPTYGWWFDILCVLLGFPLLLGLGAQARITPGLSRFWYWSGALSYPLYIIHEPVLRAAYRLHMDDRAAMLLAIILAWAALCWFDVPLRATLARREFLAKG